MQPQYPTKYTGKVRYERDTGTPGTGIPSTAILEVRVFIRYELGTGIRHFRKFGIVRYRYPHFGKFGIVSVPVPDTSASFRKNSIMVPDTWYVRYGLNTGTRHFGKVGTPTQIYPRYRYTQTAIPREQVFVGYDTGDIGYFVRQYRHVMTSAYAAFWRDTIQQYQVCWSVW